MKKLFLLGFILITLSSTSEAQDYRFHSIFIYNFTKYIQWPETSSKGDFVIGVLGESPISTELGRMAEIKKVDNNRTIVVQQFDDIRSVANCNMLFIPSAQSERLDEIINNLSGKPTLLISEDEGLATKGSHINFINIDNKWKFELNKEAIESAKLKVASELTRLAILM